MTNPFNVLISSAGRRVSLLRCFERALHDLGVEGRVLAADMSLLSSAMHCADDRFVVPRCTAPEFVQHMVELCVREQVKLVIPTIDTELPMYAQARELFAAHGVHVAVSSPDVIAISADKHKTHAWLTRHGFPTVKQASAAEVLAHPESWSFPLIAKPVAGSASIGLARVQDVDELRVVSAHDDYLVQSIAPGREYTMDVLVTGAAKAVCSVPRKRLEVRAGEVSKGVTVRHAGLQELSCRVCETLPGARGVITVQIFLDESTGEMNIIEINPRYGGGFPLACEAGANYPRWMLEELLEMPSTVERDGWTDGLVMLRYDDAVFVSSEDAGL